MVDGGGKVTGDQRTGRERSLANLRPFKPGQSGNPAGRPKGPGFFDVLCAHANEKPNAADPRTRFQLLVEAIWRRAMQGSSRHAQLLLDRLVPTKSVVKHESAKMVTVLMEIAKPPGGWEPPDIVQGTGGTGHLLASDNANGKDVTESATQ